MIYSEMPKDFDSRFDVVSCFLEAQGEILLLHRQDHKPEGNTLGVPAGKVDDGEDRLEAMLREIKEETGFRPQSSDLNYFGKVYVRYPDYDFIYHTYHMKLDKKPEVSVNHKEHKSFLWISPEKALGLPLIRDLDICIRIFYGIE